MDEYIKREAVKRLVNTNYGGFLAAIDYIPAADVVPVVHGDWLLRNIGVGHYWECSVCHTNPCIYVTEHTKFCPNCGAKMDGRGTDDN